MKAKGAVVAAAAFAQSFAPTPKTEQRELSRFAQIRRGSFSCVLGTVERESRRCVRRAGGESALKYWLRTGERERESSFFCGINCVY